MREQTVNIKEGDDQTSAKNTRTVELTPVFAWTVDLKSMSSKTILLGPSIFRCGSERSVHGRPSWELAPYDRESERTKDFTAWCRDASTECCFNERAGECGVVRFTSQFFV